MRRTGPSTSRGRPHITASSCMGTGHSIALLPSQLAFHVASTCGRRRDRAIFLRATTWIKDIDVVSRSRLLLIAMFRIRCRWRFHGSGWCLCSPYVTHRFERASTVQLVAHTSHRRIGSPTRKHKAKGRWSHDPCNDTHIDGRDEDQVHPSRSSIGQSMRRLSQEERKVRALWLSCKRHPELDGAVQEGKMHPSRSAEG